MKRHQHNPNYPPLILSPSHFVPSHFMSLSFYPLSFYPPLILSSCYFIPLSFYPPVILSLSHFTPFYFIPSHFIPYHFNPSHHIPSHDLSPRQFDERHYTTLIPEDAPVGSEVLTVVASDVDAGGSIPLTYSIKEYYSAAKSIFTIYPLVLTYLFCL